MRLTRAVHSLPNTLGLSASSLGHLCKSAAISHPMDERPTSRGRREVLRSPWGGVGWGGEGSGPHRPPSTHLPGGVEVAFGQGLVIIGVRIRKGPLSHDAAGEPAEQGKERSRVVTGPRTQTQTRRQALRQPLPSERTPAHGGSARAQDGGRGSECRGMQGARFPPTSHGGECGTQAARTSLRRPGNPRAADHNRHGAFTAHFLQSRPISGHAEAESRLPASES